MSFGGEQVRLFLLPEQSQEIMIFTSKTGLWVPVALYAAVIFYFSSLTGDKVPDPFPGCDKIFHILEYAPFGFLVMRAIRRTWSLTLIRALLSAFFVVFLYSLSDEYHQLFVPGRVFSFLDQLADVVGSALGFFLLYGKDRVFSKRPL